MSSDISSSGSTAAANDTFPEVAFFEVPSDVSRSSNSRHKELVKHPAFRQISAINGEINRMNVKHLKIELERLNFDGRGGKDVLKKRLKAYERSRILKEAGIDDPNTDQQHYTHIVVIDFEATCEEHQTKDYVHEIIEFPAVLVRVSDAARVGEFHSLVRPVLNPVLSDFCRQLTGIDQSSVDAAPTFPEVLRNFENWLAEKGVGTVTSVSGLQVSPSAESALPPPDAHSGLSQEGGVSSGGLVGMFAVATDGPWDMARFLLMQCSVSELPFPSWARSWINLRKVFSNFYAVKRLCLSEMLAALGMEFEGRPHCGLDDARNIAVIAEALLRDGASPRVNETIAHLPHCVPPSLKGSSVANVTLKDFKSSQRRRHKSSCTSSSDQTEEARFAPCSDKQTVCDGGVGDAGISGGGVGSSSGGDVGVSCGGSSDAGVSYSGRRDGVSYGSGGDGVRYSGGGGVGVGFSNGGGVGVCFSNGGEVADSCCHSGDGSVNYSSGSNNIIISYSSGRSGDVEGGNSFGSHLSGGSSSDVSDGSAHKDWMKKLCGEVCDLNVDFSDDISHKLMNGISTEVVGMDPKTEPAREAHNRTHSKPSNAPDKAHVDQCVIERNAASPNVAYHPILYSTHEGSSHTFVPHFSNSGMCDSDAGYSDTRCHTDCDYLVSSSDLSCDNANSRACNHIPLKPGHSKGNSARHGKNTAREPLPYSNFHDRRYMHYTHLNSKACKIGNRKDFNESPGNSSSLVQTEMNSHARKKIGGHSHATPANGKPGRRANNHRTSQCSSGNGDERCASKGRRPPQFRRDGVHSANDRAAQGFYSNATTNNESNTHKNIDFNDSTQFPVLGSVRRSYK